MNKQSTIMVFLLLIGSRVGVRAQQGFGTNAPNPSSVVEMKSANKGVLFPRVVLTGTDDISTIPTPADHLLVFNTATAGTGAKAVTPGFYYHELTGWVRLLGSDDVPSWHTTGNSAIADASFLGTTDAKDLVLKTNNTEQMRITASGAIGVHTSSPDPSALMELKSTTQGFLLPRMTNDQLDAIVNPVNGLLVYNTTLHCPMYYVDGLYYAVTTDSSIPSKPAAKGSTYTNHYNGLIITDDSGSYIIEYSGNSTTVKSGFGEKFGAKCDFYSKPVYCQDDLISAGGCGGAVAVKGQSGNVYPLVEINGQCWMAENSREIPSAFPTSPAWVNGADTGSWGYYNASTPNGSAGWGASVPTAGAGLLYQWSAAMNGATAERSRGICPTGFHIPSDCEWMYLEHGLGMFTAEQPGSGYNRDWIVGLVNLKLKVGGASGFSGLLSGCRTVAGPFADSTQQGYYWSSSSSTTAFNRVLNLSDPIVDRFSVEKGNALSVRCLKD
jgi:uncharacterized protein (TIGR02145 family)